MNIHSLFRTGQGQARNLEKMRNLLEQMGLIEVTTLTVTHHDTIPETLASLQSDMRTAKRALAANHSMLAATDAFLNFAQPQT